MSPHGTPEYVDFLGLRRAPPRPARHDDALHRVHEGDAPYPPALLPRLRALGDGVLLGSDSPNIPHAYAHRIEALDRLGLGENWLRGMLRGNGARLFGVAVWGRLPRESLRRSWRWLVP